MGIAPESDVVAIKILDASGRGNSAEVLAGLQWMLDNKERYNIRVANLSIGTADTGIRDPLVRAVEAAWDRGIVVAIAAGNNGPLPGSVTSPGISRKVVTIGASDDTNAVQIWGDTLENFSGRGPTSECIIKPDIVAPGADIVSCLSPSMSYRNDHDAKIIAQNYLRLSGTSMSTPMVTGAIALLLEKNPELTPNDVKLIIKKSAVSLNYDQNQQGWGMIDIKKMLDFNTRGYEQ